MKCACLLSNGGVAPATATLTPIGPTPTPIATVPPATCPSILSNPGFEQGFSGWVRWDANNAIVPDAHSGNRAIRLGTAVSGIGQGRDAMPGQSYSLNAYAKVSDGTTPALLGLTFFDAQWTGINSQSIANISGTAYQAYTVSKVAPVNERYLIAWVSQLQAGAYLLVDDFCLTSSASAGNVVQAQLRLNTDGAWLPAEAVQNYAVWLPLLGN